MDYYVSISPLGSKELSFFLEDKTVSHLNYRSLWLVTGVIGLVLILSACSASADTTTLVREGVAQATIILSPDAGELEVLAAQELQTHIQKMSGVQLPIVRSVEQAGGVKILIGRAVPDEELTEVRAAAPDAFGREQVSFRLRVMPNEIQVAGLSGRGSLFAAYELLEQLGIRWFIPDEIGTVIPESRTVAIRQQDTIQHPGFAGRTLSLDSGVKTGEWFRRMRMGGFNSGGHGYGIRADGNEEPELFMTKDGRRTGKLRISHPEVLRRTIAKARATLEKNPRHTHLSIGPEDGLGFGEDEWDAGDTDPLHGRISISDRLVKFLNLILDDLQEDYPDVGIGFYCYSQHMRPPVREKPNPKILPILAPIDVCRLHAIDNPRCWERHYIDDIIQGWKALGVQMMYRGYLFNLADQGLPFGMIRQVRAEYPYYHQQGMIACRVECKPAWAYHGPALYLAAKLMWDPKADAEAVLSDYFSKFYGPAGTAMREHFELLEDAYEKADYHTGNVFDIPHILTPKVMKKMERALVRAEGVVPADSMYFSRVKMIRVAFEFGKSTLEMMAAMNRFDFEQAHQHLQRIKEELLPVALKHKPAILSLEYGLKFTDRFWTNTVGSAYQRVSDGNEIVARLPDEWLFLLDPYNGGEKLGLWRPETGTQSWRTIKTYSQSWSNQGLRYYKGVCWYRSSVDVPSKYAGRKVRLWLGGVDESAKAWINGKELALMSSGAAPMGRPWEFDADETLKFGQSNTIVVKVTNGRLNELGTGGLTMPAMLWARKSP